MKLDILVLGEELQLISISPPESDESLTIPSAKDYTTAFISILYLVNDIKRLVKYYDECLGVVLNNDVTIWVKI